MSAAPVVYNFSPADGSFVGASSAVASPLEPGVWHYPAFSTTIAPPTPGAGQAAVFVDDAWDLVADHRGEIWYQADGAAVTIVGLGDPAAANLNAAPPPPPAPTLATLADAAIAAAQGACADLTAQIASDPTRQNAYLVAAGMIGGSGVAPSADPAKTAFAALASAFGLDPATLATRVGAFSAASFMLSAALATFQHAAPAATTADELRAALTTFEGALATIVATAAAAGVTLIPPSIAVAGLTPEGGGQ